MPALAGSRRLRVVVEETSESFDVLVVDGMASCEVLAAVVGRSGLGGSVYCTLERGRGGAVVPVSAMLPDGTTLYLHGVLSLPLRSRSRSQERRRSEQAMVQMDLLPPGTRKRSDEDRGSYFALGDGGDEAAGGGGRDPGPEAVEDRRTEAELVSDQLTAVERFSRLTTELANERTLLAWIRTTLASMRTAYSLSSLQSNDGSFWRVLTEAAELIICGFTIATAFNGIFRYQRIKDALLSRTPLKRFGRRTLRPYNGLVSLVAVAVAIVIFQRRLLLSNPHGRRD